MLLEREPRYSTNVDYRQVQHTLRYVVLTSEVFRDVVR